MNTTQSTEQTYEALIMIVDDNPEFIEGIEMILNMEGYKILTAANGQEALDMLDQIITASQVELDLVSNHLPDLFLVDIMMPEMDGYEFYERVQANPHLNEIPFVFLTAKTGQDDIRFGKELGPDDYLTKPCSPEDLLASVRGKLRRVEQRRQLRFRIFGDPLQTPKSGVVIAIAIIGGLVVLAFCLGILFATNWL